MTGFDPTKDRNAPDGFFNPYEPTYWNQLAAARRLLSEKGYDEVRSHARVATHNGCRCRSCFCCACVEVLREHAIKGRAK
jgi:hypothetical protein